MMRGFCPRGFCPEGAYVLMELCMEGVLSKGVLSEGVLSKGVLSGGGFVLPSHYTMIQMSKNTREYCLGHVTLLQCYLGR